MQIKNRNIYDVIIIGGGPIGMFAAYYAGLRTLKVQLIESLGKLGGQLAALYPEKEMINVPGFAQIKATDFIERLDKQLNGFPVNVLLNNTVDTINYSEGVFEIETDKTTTYSKTIIIATGIGPFEPRKLPLLIDETTENKFISYYVRDPRSYQGLNVAIAGGGDGAIDTALQLLNHAEHLTIIHRREGFRALESNMAKIKNSPVKIMTPYVISALNEENGKLKINLQKARESEIKEIINADRLIVSYGFKANNRIQQNWGVELERNLITVNQKMETSRPGIYAIGDATIYPYKQKILANGFGEVPIAVNSAIEDYSLTSNRNIHGIVQ
ncbi:NAD(P)/FAD-dependent oxidoreductase [Xylocopilactobacillus apicola]|uniref:Ferredoxin--NADP reductase n=1 Tax=Xylocopilactobacillus apicola TaxID=2932184 RepID=A0AAU9DWM8_9LACO|nr:NAD(P)/FAD-dependent oxidoreductase [Xylocopilactobacillus apicola]BDR58428.1 ferredoxin--NADP reductase [Xylocopilactobacillus apicola]